MLDLLPGPDDVIALTISGKITGARLGSATAAGAGRRRLNRFIRAPTNHDRGGHGAVLVRHSIFCLAYQKCFSSGVTIDRFIAVTRWNTAID